MIRSLHRHKTTFSALLLLTTLAGCGDGSEQRQPREEPSVAVLYDSVASPPVLPFPNAAYAADNGRLALPLPADADPADLGNVVVAVNTLDGFSTIAPLYVDFAEAIDSASIAAGENIRVFAIAVDGDNLPVEILAELTAGEDYRVSVSAVMDSRLLLKPLRPLQSAAEYLVGVSNDLRAVSGLRMGPSADYIALRKGAPPGGDGDVDRQYLSALIGAQEALLANSGMAQGSVVTSFSFGTHATGDVLSAINRAASAMPVTLLRPTMVIGDEVQPLTTLPFSALAAFFGLTPSGQSDIYTGTIDLPYYMNIPADPADDSLLDSYLRDQAGAPILGVAELPQSAPVTAPLLLSIPNPSRDASLVRPPQGWPVAIYHHGVGYNRANMLLIADALASRGVAMAAIDHPVHGVTPNDAATLPLNLFAAVGVSFYDAEHERHFNLDLDADGEIDEAGRYINSPRNQLTYRDNLRQSVSDFIYLARTLPTIALPGFEERAFDPDRIHYVGNSLGSIVGTMLAGVNSDIRAFSLAMPAAGGAKSLEGSPSYRQGLIDQLAAIGLEQGNQDYEDYLGLLTTIEGPGAPINYGALASQSHAIYVTEIIGDGTPDNPPDQTIPNDVENRGQYAELVVETAPLAGTEPLIRSMGLEALYADVSNPDGLRVAARYLRGDHTSLVNPSDSIGPYALPEVTVEIQLQAATFVASDGERVDVNDSSLLEANYMPPE